MEGEREGWEGREDTAGGREGRKGRMGEICEIVYKHTKPRSMSVISCLQHNHVGPTRCKW